MGRSTLDFCAGAPEQTFEAGRVILEEGVPGPLYVLAEGAVEILKGEYRINVVDEPGSIFGEVSVLLGGAPMATVRALVASRLFVIEDGSGFLGSRPELALDVARLLARRLRSLTSYLVDLKRQFEGHGHLGMIDDVLETLAHDPSPGDHDHTGSDREPDPND